MPSTLVGSRWVAGALEFFDKATGDTVLAITPSGVAEATAAGSTATTLPNYGLSTITIASSSAGTKGFALAAPATGVRKHVSCATASTGGVSTVTLASGTYDGTTTIATFSSQGELDLIGTSTARYSIVAKSTSITLS